MQEYCFEQKFVFSLDVDLIIFCIWFNLVDFVLQQGVRLKQLNFIKLNIYGGLKVNVSVGVSFVCFFDWLQLYSVWDFFIVVDDQDVFLLIIFSFFYFYLQSWWQVFVGGIFGFGIGVGGDNVGL